LKKRNKERVIKQGYEIILVQPIQDLKDMVAQVPALHSTAEMMIKEAGKKEDPLGEPSLKSWEEFLTLLNEIMVTAPEYTVCGPDPKDPCGLVGCPINALLNWPMQTEAGYMLFSNQLINHQLKKILK
jgi:phosphatidylserine decarboxylase